MAQKSIYEMDAKKILAKELPKYYPNFNYHNKLLTNFDKVASENPWLKTDKMVVKPDQLFGKRGKANLILLDANYEQMKNFCKSNLNKVFEIGNVRGELNRLLVEPFIPHEKEYYVSITTERNHDIIHFSFEGGIFVEENWEKVIHIPIPVGTDINSFDLETKIPNLGDFKDNIIPFIKGLYQVFVN